MKNEQSCRKAQRGYVTGILLFEANSELKSLLKSFTLTHIPEICKEEFNQNSSGNNNHNIFGVFFFSGIAI